MKPNQNAAAATKQAAPSDPGRSPIPVAALYFADYVVMPMPGRQGGKENRAHALIAGPAAGASAAVEIEFRPWIRHHRVSWSLGDQRGVFFVHESVATWTPAGE